MQTTDGIVGQHNIPRVLTSVKAAPLRAAPPQAAAALTPAPRALHNGQLSDDAGPQPSHSPRHDGAGIPTP